MVSRWDGSVENEIPNQQFDIAIVGAGGAGLSAAIEATIAGVSVMVLTRGDLYDCKTARAQGGIQASVNKDDSPENHMRDTLAAGNQVANPELAKILAFRARDTVQWLEKHGVQFDQRDGEYLISKAAGLSHSRVLSCGDSAGRGIMDAISRTAADYKVPVREHSAVLKIQKSDGAFLVDVCDVKNNQTYTIQAGSVIIATGGVVAEEKKAGLVSEQEVTVKVPDGLALAEGLGAKIVSPELQQFHPTGVVMPELLRRKRIPETVRGDGAKLLNRHGEEFADPLMTRNELSQRIVDECRAGNGIETEDGRIGVWLDTPLVESLHGDGYIAKRYPNYYKMFLEQGHDLAKKRVLVYPIVHYSLGGIEIDVNAMTCVSGLFAAGETTWGVHGEDRLMGNSLLDIFVFGRIAGQQSAEFVKQANGKSA